MNDAVAIVIGVAVTLLAIALWGKWIYDRFLAPEYSIRVTVLGKGTAWGVRWLVGRSGSARNPRIYYWGEFQEIETGETMKLNMDVNLYIDIKEGWRGVLTYRKGVALSFQRAGRKKKRDPILSEKMMGFFRRRV